MPSKHHGKQAGRLQGIIKKTSNQKSLHRRAAWKKKIKEEENVIFQGEQKSILYSSSYTSI